MYKLLAIFIALALSGCAAVDDSAVHETLQNRDKMVRDAHRDSGMQMAWQAVEKTVYYPGMKGPVTVTEYLPTFSYKEKADFNQKLPTAPAEHPGYRVAERLGSALIQGTVVGLGITATADVLKTAIDSAGHNTTASHNTDGSHNIDDSGNSDSSATAYDYSDNSDNSNNSDNSIGPVDNSDSSDNSEIDNSNNSDGSVDNSVVQPVSGE